MALPSAAELLNFIAREEPLEKTLERFPGVSREALRAILREAAVLLHAEHAGVALAEAPPRTVPSPAPERPSEPKAAREPATRAPTPVHAPTVEHEAGAQLEPAKRLRLYTDGAARGNPGPAGAGAVLMKPDGTLVSKMGKFLGNQTNNYAEYMGLLIGLETALRLGAEELEVYADSQLLIRQLEGAYKVKAEGLKPLFAQAKTLLGRFKRVTLTHVPREQNPLADEMSNRAIDELL